MATISILAFLSCFAFFFFHIHLSIALDCFYQGQSLSGDQTLVSKGGIFELGFFTPGNSHNYYLGIWYKKVPKQTVIWVANRERPVPNASSLQLMISKDSNLVLKSSKIQIWSSSSTFPSSNSTFATLSYDGNFVLKDRLTSHILWQSFDHPTNTWLPGAKLGYNKLTGEHHFLTSWRNSEDPSPGIFSLLTDPNGSGQSNLLWNRTKSYWSTGVWDGQGFSLIPEMKSNYLFHFKYESNINVNYFSYAFTDPSIISNFMLDDTGQMKHRQWDSDTQDWVLFCEMPRDPCQVYAACGPFGSCDNSSSPTCRCLEGFKPLSVEKWNLVDTTRRCVRKTPLYCGHNHSLNAPTDGFMLIPNIEPPTSPESLAVGSAKECEIACLHNCSCAAYSYVSGCLIWIGDLLNLKKLSTEPNGQQSRGLYVRLAASELQKPQSRRKKGWTTAVLVGFAAGFCIIFGTALVLILMRRRTPSTGALVGIQGFLVPFQYKVLQKATKNFSERLGRGGFGSVFKGVLPELTTVAVKKLEGLRQGEKQFRMEVNTIGMIQHVNLVRLHGFCSEGDKRLLVYEYLPEGSLDSHLFAKNSNILDWKHRYQIILGIARGLAYLHEKCRECIIHCDIKPENILLDSDLYPKLADFGMAKLFGREYSRVLTTMRGTLGYLAPEWLSGGSITPKADVYSFGMMLFEIISGRRNSEVSINGASFPLWSAIKLQEDDVLCLLDQRLEGKANLEELNRACRIACWCIQDHEDARPAMGAVVQVLEQVVDIDLPPIPRMLQNLVDNANVGSLTGESITAESTKYFTCNTEVIVDMIKDFQKHIYGLSFEWV